MDKYLISQAIEKEITVEQARDELVNSLLLTMGGRNVFVSR